MSQVSGTCRALLRAAGTALSFRAQAAACRSANSQKQALGPLRAAAFLEAESTLPERNRSACAESSPPWGSCVWNLEREFSPHSCGVLRAHTTIGQINVIRSVPVEELPFATVVAAPCLDELCQPFLDWPVSALLLRVRS